MPPCGLGVPRRRILTEPSTNATSAEFEARSEEMQQILFSDETPALEIKAVTETETEETELTTEEKTETVQSAEPMPRTVSKSSPRPQNLSQAIKRSSTASLISMCQASTG